MTPICRRPDSNVHRYIEDRAPGTSDQFALRPRRRLKVKTTQYTASRRDRGVFLYEILMDPVLSQDVRSERFREKSPLILMSFSSEKQESLNFEPGHPHLFDSNLLDYTEPYRNTRNFNDQSRHYEVSVAPQPEKRFGQD